MRRKFHLLRLFILASILSACSGSDTPEWLQSTFDTMQMCVAGVPIYADSSVGEIYVDKPNVVRGVLKNGANFSCKRNETGTKGIHFIGIFEDIKKISQAPVKQPTIAASRSSTINDSWSDHQICGGVVETYFMTKSAPKYVGNERGTYAYRTPLGQYNCKLTGEGHTYLSWTNKSGQSMTSTVTRYKFDGDFLKVISDLQSSRFKTVGENLIKVPNE